MYENLFLYHNEAKYIKVLGVLDVSRINDSFYYKVIFQNVQTKEIYEPKVFDAQEFRERLEVDKIYYQKLAIGSEIEIIKKFSIDNRKSLELVKVSNILSTKDIDWIPTKYRNNFLNQYCYILDYDEYQTIIPVYAILNRFYFLSSRLKKALIRGSLDNIHRENCFKRIDDDHVEIYIKNIYIKKDIFEICRFLENEYSKNSFLYIVNQLQHLEDRTYNHIKARFPVNEKFNIHTNCKVIKNRKKLTYFVTNINYDDSSYNFSCVICKRRVNKIPDIDEKTRDKTVFEEYFYKNY